MCLEKENVSAAVGCSDQSVSFILVQVINGLDLVK